MTQYLRKYFKCFIFCFLPLIGFNQISNTDSHYIDIDRYNTEVVPPEFLITFKIDEKEKNNFKKLREFLKEKTALSNILEDELYSYNNDAYLVPVIMQRISDINSLIKEKKPNDSIKIKVELLQPIRSKLGFRSYLTKDTLDIKPIKTTAELNDVLNNFKTDLENIKKETTTITILEKNIRNIKQDIDKCTSQIDTALAPEYQQQDFRKTISIYFTMLIALLLSIFFFIVFKKSDASLSKDLLSGNGLQFVTLFVLIIAVILFGILGILESSELAAILSGISGYILGKGTQKDFFQLLPTTTVNETSNTNKTTDGANTLTQQELPSNALETDPLAPNTEIVETPVSQRQKQNF